MLEIDGSQGEGGGQVLRTSVSLAALTGTAVEIDRIRAHRSNAGLRPQHKTAIEACARICDAETRDVAIGSKTIEFHPRSRPRGGDWHFSVGTAGSIILVLQTLLPPLLAARNPSSVTVEGGTHTLKAPIWEYFSRTYLPVLERMGGRLSAELERYGFYPKGGGEIRMHVEPPEEEFSPLELLDRGEVRRVAATSMVERLPRQIAERELATLADALPASVDLQRDIAEIEESASPGNVLFVEVETDAMTTLLSRMGRKGLPAEKVALELADRLTEFLDSAAPVDAHLADQLVVPVAMAGGGAYVTTEPTSHLRTQLALVPRFLDVTCHTRPVDERRSKVEIEANGAPRRTTQKRRE